jgi:creatinine amidohydrolase/Fe(II)-dependent formamide hydrolase-like protein
LQCTFGKGERAALGDPTLATAQKGEKIFVAALAAATDAVQCLLSADREVLITERFN